MRKMITREPQAQYQAQHHIQPSAEPPARDSFRKLEALEKELEFSSNTGHGRWMVPYADLLTLLLGLFLVLFTASKAPAGSQHGVASQTPTPVVAQASKPAQQQANKLEASKDKDAQLAAKIEKQLGAGFKLKGIAIRQQERGLVISLKDSILFAPGSADLSPTARKTLDRLTQQLTSAMGGASRPIRVEGHTDNTPITTARYPSNWELSTARATNIVRYLVASRRFSPQMLSAAGYGQFKPVENNSSIEGKQKNRRVDIVILNENTAHQEPPALHKTAPQKSKAKAAGAA